MFKVPFIHIEWRQNSDSKPHYRLWQESEDSCNLHFLPESVVVEEWDNCLICYDWFPILKSEVNYKQISLSELMKDIDFTPYQDSLKTNIEVCFPPEYEGVQEDAVKFIVEKKQALLWLPTGSGKTKIILDVLAIFAEQDKINRIVWICRAGLPCEQILKNAKMFTPQLEKMIEFMPTSKFSSHFWMQNGKLPDENTAIIIDECHDYKTGISIGGMKTSNRANNIVNYIKYNYCCYGITATPIGKDYMDLFAISQILFPQALSDDNIRNDKKGLYKYFRQNKRGWYLKNPIELIRKIGNYMFFREESSYTDPNLTIHDCGINLTTEQQQFVKNEFENQIIEFNTDFPSAFKLLSAAFRAVNLLKNNDKIHPKIAKLLEILQCIPYDDQILIFVRTINEEFSDLQLIIKALQETNYTFAILNGAIAQNDRKIIVGKFREKQTKILITSYGVGSTSLDLPEANHTILFALSWDNLSILQAIGRMRAGNKYVQKKPCFVYKIYCHNTIEYRVNCNLQRKSNILLELSKAVMDKNQKAINDILFAKNYG